MITKIIICFFFVMHLQSEEVCPPNMIPGTTGECVNCAWSSEHCRIVHKKTPYCVVRPKGYIVQTGNPYCMIKRDKKCPNRGMCLTPVDNVCVTTPPNWGTDGNGLCSPLITLQKPVIGECKPDECLVLMNNKCIKIPNDWWLDDKNICHPCRHFKERMIEVIDGKPYCVDEKDINSRFRVLARCASNECLDRNSTCVTIPDDQWKNEKGECTACKNVANRCLSNKDGVKKCVEIPAQFISQGESYCW